jgi:hypothetical protein
VEKLGANERLPDVGTAQSGAVSPDYSSIASALSFVIDRWFSLTPAARRKIVDIVERDNRRPRD